jgi:hypothetical protein
MTTSPDWKKSLFNHEQYDTLLNICHGRCVKCGTRDFLLFERIDEGETPGNSADEKFSFWFGGLNAKKTAAVCLNCSLEARVQFWDRRLSRAIFGDRVNSKCFLKPRQYYYGLLTSRITFPGRVKSGYYENTHRRDVERAYRLKDTIITHLGGVCTVCSQDNHLHIDTVRPQLLAHCKSTESSGVEKSVRYWMHQLCHDNLQVLCEKHHREKSSNEMRAFGSLRRLFSGRSLITWRSGAHNITRALGHVLTGGEPTPARELARDIPFNCSVQSCGHLSEITVLFADHLQKMLVFACNECADNYRGTMEPVCALLEERNWIAKLRWQTKFARPCGQSQPASSVLPVRKQCSSQAAPAAQSAGETRAAG